MMNIIETLKSTLGMSLSKHSADFFKEEHSNTSTAVNGTFAAILAGMVQRVSHDKGAKDLHKILSNEKYKDYDIEDIFTRSPQTVNGLVNRGTHFLPSIYPGKLREASNAVAQESSIKKLTSSKMMKVSAPLVLNALAKHVQENKLDVNGLKSYLNSQKSHISGALPKDFSDQTQLSAFGWDKTKVVKEETVVDTKVQERVERRAEKKMKKKLAQEEKLAAVTPEPVAASSGTGFLKWLLPLLLILIGCAWLLSRMGCGAADNVAKTVTAPVEVVTTAAKDVSKVATNVFGKVNDAALSALGNIKFAAGSVGTQMLDYIKSGSSADGRFRFNNLNFSSGSAEIEGETGVEIDNLSSILKAYPDLKIKVEGYTDSQGDANNNQVLSQQRAETVMNRLVTQGITAERITTAGLGATNPIGDNATPEGRAENRRIEVIIVK